MKIQLYPLGRLVAQSNDFGEADRVETGTSHERSIDLGLRHECGDAIWFNASSVDDPAGGGGVRTELLLELSADMPVRGVGLFWRGDVPGTLSLIHI